MVKKEGESNDLFKEYNQLYQYSSIPFGVVVKMIEMTAEKTAMNVLKELDGFIPDFLTSDQVMKTLDLTRGMYKLLIDQGELENLNRGGGKDKISRASFLHAREKLSRLRHNKKRKRLTINDLR